MADFTIKRNDTLRPFRCQLLETDGTPVDLTGATVRFHLADRSGNASTLNEAAVIETTASGIVRYDWQTGDTIAAGRYAAEWEVTFSGGGIRTFPNARNLTVEMPGDLA